MKIRIYVAAVLTAASAAGSVAIATEAKAPSTVVDFQRLYGQNLRVFGPVERVDLARRTLVVAGQNIVLDAKTLVSINGVVIRDSARALQLLATGQVVAVDGDLGAAAVSVAGVHQDYVAGATLLFVRGVLTKFDSATGRASLDALAVDLTPAMSDPSVADAKVGEIESIVGVRPAAGSALLAQSVSRVTTSSITGTGQTSITGTGQTSITGTGKTSITGTGQTSITGTGQTSITGTGKTSITGTGQSSITGTGKTSITGTGKSSITGTGQSSITGTGKTSITGTGQTSITGTGKTSITGTGQTSITGTGQTSITGTGKTSITGTGQSSITGTGRS